MASYVAQIRCLTVPELRDLAKRHRLDSSGKKAQLLMRLSIWVRDEVASGIPPSNDSDDDEDVKQSESSSAKPNNDIDEFLSCNSDDSDDEDDSDSSSEEKLELIGDKPDLRAKWTDSGSVSKYDTESRGLRPSRQTTHQDNESSSDDDSDSDAENECSLASQSQSKPESSMHSTLRKLFGHSNFRDGQEWAIDRCLNKQRSLLVAPTGFGKSLCFTLPAAMMDGVCIVVSPLLSLIQDQIRILPARLPAVTLSGPMSTASMAASLDDVLRSRIKVLFVSPERLTSSSFRRLFRQRWDPEARVYNRMFPTVSLFCVDEAHCLSQWAHNFRPSYLRLRSMMELIEPQSVLAITATAGPRVITDICRTLQIEHGSSSDGTNREGVRISKTDRDNIDVSCHLLDTQEERLAKVRNLSSTFCGVGLLF